MILIYATLYKCARSDPTASWRSLEALSTGELRDDCGNKLSVPVLMNKEDNLRVPHSSFWRALAAARSPGGQVAVMHAFAAFWKFMFVQTQARSALRMKKVRTTLHSVKRGTH